MIITFKPKTLLARSPDAYNVVKVLFLMNLHQKVT